MARALSGDPRRIERFVDPEHYSRVSGRSWPSARAAAEHYTEVGSAEALDPNPYFVDAWYRWQHPPSLEAATPLHHFVRRGAKRKWDPSPDVDFAKYCHWAGMSKHPVRAYERLLRRGAPVVAGVYSQPDDLPAAQRSFLAATAKCDVMGLDRDPPRKNLVFLQNRRSPRLFSWVREPHRSFDVWVNFYDPEKVSVYSGDIVSSQVGTKFTAIANLYGSHGEVFDRYEYVWLLDDDIELTARQLDAAFHLARMAGADLAQPSLSSESHCMWPALHHRRGSRWRQVSTVEIMMPIYSQRLAQLVFPHFHRSVSGFGLDLLAGKLCGEVGGTAVVLDEVVAHHRQRIDQAGGEYYQFLRANDINAKAELWRLATELDLERAITEVHPLAVST